MSCKPGAPPQGYKSSCKQALKARFSRPGNRTHTRVNRAFSAGALDFTDPGALPQAQGECCAVGAEHAQTGLSASLLTSEVAHR